MRVYHPGFGADIQVGRYELSEDSDTAVAQTIALMARYVREDRQSPHVQNLASSLAGGSVVELKQNVFQFVKSRVRFTPDHAIAEALRLPHSTTGFLDDVAEVLIRPIDLLRMRDAQGDCDDFSMLGAALLSAAGVPVFFVTLAADSRAPEQYSHVYVLAGRDPFDTSHGPMVGWEARNRFGKRQEWSVETGMPILGRTGTGFPIIAGLSSLGQCVDPESGESVDCGGSAVPGGGGGVMPTVGQGGTPWWAGDINAALNATLSIFKARYAVPPAGTVITTRAGTIATGVQPGTVIGTPGSIFSQIPLVVWIIGGLALVLLLARGRR